MTSKEHAANEPVDYDDGIVDTGVLHEKPKCDVPKCNITRPHNHSEGTNE